MKTSVFLRSTILTILLFVAACEPAGEPSRTESAQETGETSIESSDTASSPEAPDESIQTLASSAQQLVDDFNSISGKKKLVMILSPT
jgi:hypothetical protein